MQALFALYLKEQMNQNFEIIVLISQYLFGDQMVHELLTDLVLIANSKLVI